MRFEGSVKTILAIAATVVVIAGLRESGGFFLPVLSALFITVISTPLMAGLAKLRVPRGAQIVLTVLLDVAVLAGIIALVAESLSGFEDALPRYEAAVDGRLHEIVAFSQEHGIPIEQDDVEGLGNPDAMMNLVGTLFRELTTLVSNALLVVLLVVFMLFEITPATEKLRVLLGAHASLEEFADAAAQLQRYLVVKTYLSALIGTLTGASLAIVGVDFPLLWGLLAFLLNYIPSIGAFIALVPPVVIAFLMLGPGAAIAALVACLVINFVVGNMIEPRMMGVALGLSTLVVFCSMLFWGWVWGPIGALFAVPVTMLLRSALAVSADTRWLAVLLSSGEWVDKKRREWGWTTVAERSSSGTLITPAMLERTAPKGATPGDRAVEKSSAKLEASLNKPARLDAEPTAGDRAVDENADAIAREIATKRKRTDAAE
jgi:AI-2 transport protein TqsA